MDEIMNGFIGQFPMTQDITNISIKPAQAEKAEWSKPLQEVAVTAYIVAMMPVRTGIVDPNSNAVLIACGGNEMERELLFESIKEAMANAPKMTKNKKGLYKGELEDSDRMNQILDKIMDASKQVQKMNQTRTEANKPGLVRRFIRWLL